MAAASSDSEPRRPAGCDKLLCTQAEFQLSSWAPAGRRGRDRSRVLGDAAGGSDFRVAHPFYRASGGLRLKGSESADSKLQWSGQPPARGAVRRVRAPPSRRVGARWALGFRRGRSGTCLGGERDDRRQRASERELARGRSGTWPATSSRLPQPRLSSRLATAARAACQWPGTIPGRMPGHRDCTSAPGTVTRTGPGPGAIAESGSPSQARRLPAAPAWASVIMISSGRGGCPAGTHWHFTELLAPGQASTGGGRQLSHQSL